MKFLKIMTIITMITANSAYGNPFSITVPKLPNLRTIEVGVPWSRTNTPTYKFFTLGFTTIQSQKIQSSLIYIYNILKNAQTVGHTGPMSDLQICATNNTTRYFNPNWMEDGYETRRYVSGVISAMMVLGGGGGIFKAYTETTPKEGREFVSAGFAPVNTIKAGAKVEVNLNTNFIDNSSMVDIAGTIFHEMLHNAGWSHPNTGKYSDYPGTFIKEADKCVEQAVLAISSSLGKAPSTNKSRYTFESL